MIATRDNHRFTELVSPHGNVQVSSPEIRAHLFDDPASTLRVLLQKDPAPGTCWRSCANAKRAPAFYF
jgi:hypothetical protein